MDSAHKQPYYYYFNINLKLTILLVILYTCFLYYYVCEINNREDVFIDYRYPINTKVKKGTEVIVIMVEGEKKYKDYIILDKETKKVLSDYRTRFDIIDC